MPAVKRTYGSNRTLRPPLPSPPRSSYSSDPTELNDALPTSPLPARQASKSSLQSSLGKRKRALSPSSDRDDDDEGLDLKAPPSNLLDFLMPKVVNSSSLTRPAKKPLTQSTLFGNTATPSTRVSAGKYSKKSAVTHSTRSASSKKPLTQLHLTLAKSSLKACTLCSLSYTRGSPEDEELHKKHCARISRGAEWGRDEARAEGKEVTVVEEGIMIQGPNGTEERGRIIKFNANVGGKVGAKLALVLQTVNHALSSPDLPPEILADSKAYLFLLSSAATYGGSNPVRDKEKIVGCVIAQRIENAMKIIPNPTSSIASDPTPVSTPPYARSESSFSDDAAEEDPIEPTPLTHVTVHYSDSDPSSNSSTSKDSDSGLFCSPTPLPTPLGIPRMFVSSSHRHKGIAQSLLNAATRTFIHGCPLDPKLGQVAFSQPTRAGRAVMEKWGKGGVRIYEE